MTPAPPEPVRDTARLVAAIVAAIIGGAVALSVALVQFLQAFGIPLDPAQAAAIQNVVSVVVSIVGAVLTILKGGQSAREKVTPIDAPTLAPGTAVTVLGSEQTLTIPTPGELG